MQASMQDRLLCRWGLALHGPASLVIVSAVHRDGGATKFPELHPTSLPTMKAVLP